MTSPPRRDELPVDDQPSARVVLLDHDDRLLLFEGCDPDLPEVTFWYPPGGGVEDGESPLEAATRELREETGCTTAEFGPAVWTNDADFVFLGRRVRRRNTYFLARAAAFEVDTSGFDAVEVASNLQHRWWTLDDLAATAEPLRPAELPRLLSDLLRDGAPAEPVHLAP